VWNSPWILGNGVEVEDADADLHFHANMNSSINLHDSHGNTPLLNACRKRDIEAVELIISEGGEDVNRSDHPWQTPLIIATPQLDIMKILIEHGADVNYCEERGGFHALYYTAVIYGDIEATKLLLKNGADPNLHILGIKTILDCVISDDTHKSPVIMASILINKGARCSKKRDYTTIINPDLRSLLQRKACCSCGRQCRKLCAECRTVRYCDAKCQKKHWKTHRYKCIVLD
jgi:ankyrin repeat protein